MLDFSPPKHQATSSHLESSSNLKRGGFQKAPTWRNEEEKRRKGNICRETSTDSCCCASSSYFKMNYGPKHKSLFRRVAWAQLLLCIPTRKTISHMWPLLRAESNCAPSAPQDKLPPCVQRHCNPVSHLPASRNTISHFIIWEPKARAKRMHFLHLITPLPLACSA